MKWTSSQLEAINLDNTNIIVSAGAGSGKTAVLTARVLRKLSTGISVNELLILTFTKNAASEMKDRIRKKLLNDPNLTLQLQLLDESYITTFDSFAMSIVRKYHYLLNIDADLSIGDKSLIDLAKINILDEIMDSFYESENPDFIKIINDFCFKDDESLKKTIIKIYDQLDLKYDKTSYLEGYLESYFSQEYFNKIEQNYLELIKLRISNIKELFNDLLYLAPGDYYTKLENTLIPLFESNDYESIKRCLNIKLPSLPKNSIDELKDKKDALSKELKELNNICHYNSLEEIFDEILRTKEYIKVLVEILKQLDNKILEYKKEMNLYEFGDIAKMAIKIVQSHMEVKEELKKSFQEIMIDEYQDTSDLQELFISLIQNNNVYMVGDVKQGIYRFRNANLNIFKNKYLDYQQGINGHAIDLNQNFRSRQEVINNINLIFENLMDDTIGGVDYKNGHQMIYGNHQYDLSKENNNLEIYNYEYNPSSEFSKEEQEIFLIASDIKNKIDTHYQVLDRENNTLRDVEYQDFAILIDRLTSYELYLKIFKYLNIPLTVYRENKITDDNILNIIKHIINLIIKQKNNEYDLQYKYSYMSISRSFLFNYSDEDLFDVITTRSFYKLELYQKIDQLTQVIDLPLKEIILKIIDIFAIYEKLIKIENINENIIKMESIINNINNLSQQGYNIEDYLAYLNNIQDSGLDIKYSLFKEKSRTVQLMSIHGSKGLEYKICYYPSLYKKFNRSDINDIITYDDSLGLIMPYFDGYYYNTILDTILRYNYIKEETSEKIRLLYVALTRSCEKIILIVDGISSSDNLNNYQKLRCTSFKSMINLIGISLSNYVFNIDMKNIFMSHDYLIKATNNMEIKKTEKIIQIQEMKSINASKNKATFSKNIHKLITKQELEAMKIGTTLHEMFENIDLTNPKLDCIKDDKMKNYLSRFLKQDILKDIKKAKIYQEYEFVYMDDDTEYHGIIDLMLEYNTYIDIIDYKLKNIKDENYLIQLNGYKEYIERMTNKSVNIYLYSIMDNYLEKLN